MSVNSIRKSYSVFGSRGITIILSTVYILSPTPSFAMDITLQWDANLKPDLAGYKIYYKTGSSGSSYDGTGIDQGN
jgi:hypothetical protein